VEADRRLARYRVEEDDIAHRLWPDGAVDLFSDLLSHGRVVEARYEPGEEWHRLFPGFKEAALEADPTDDRRIRLRRALELKRQDKKRSWDDIGRDPDVAAVGRTIFNWRKLWPEDVRRILGTD
jgi:hypothetical protein